MRLLWTYLRPHWRLGLLALLLAGASQVPALVDPIIFGAIIDDHAIGRAGKSDTIAFVGPSGSGKSTPVKLLVGLYAPGAGSVSYNAISTGDFRYNMVRRQMHANTIFVLEKGSIVEQGTHEALRAARGLYYAMWRQQIGERPHAPNSTIID